MKPVFSKPVFLSLAVLTLAAGCSLQNGREPFGQKKAPVQPQPPSSVCAGLDLSACSANPSCEATRSVCAGCQANGTCANTTCFECKDKQPQGSPCIGLSEAQCNADPLCHANYSEMACAMVMPEDGGKFECPSVYTGCSVNLPPQDPCAGLPESMCAAPFCRPIYVATAIACPVSDPNCNGLAYLGCEINVTSCLTNCDCAVNEYCHMELVYPDLSSPVPPPDVADGGLIGGCVSAPVPVGVCKRVPGVDPVPVSVDADAGSPSFGGNAP